VNFVVVHPLGLVEAVTDSETDAADALAVG